MGVGILARAREVLMRILPDHMCYVPIGSPAGTGYAIAAMLDFAAKEREEAAKVAEEWASSLRPGSADRANGHAEAARDIAAAIRAQGGERG